MKKIFAFILCIFMLSGFCSCTDPALFGNLSLPDDTETIDPDIPSPENLGELSEDMNIEFYKKDDITLIADTYYIDTDGDVMFSCSVVNNSNKTISVALKYPEINGICSAEDSGWGEARKGETININLDIDSEFLSYAGITTVDEFAFRYTVYNENGRTISDEENKYICFTAGNDDYEQIINKEGTTVIDEEDCKIIIREFYDGEEGIDIIACFINDSDRILKYQVSNALINETSFDVNFLDTFVELPSYSMTYYRFTIFDSDLNRYGITADSVDSMSISASVYNNLEELLYTCEDEEIEI